MIPDGSVREDRENAIIRGIMSGGNACESLLQALKSGNGPEFLRSKITPILQVYESETQQLRLDRDLSSLQVEEYRQELEYIIANVAATAPAHIQAHAERVLERGNKS